jgi:hypothetical protein
MNDSTGRFIVIGSRRLKTPGKRGFRQEPAIGMKNALSHGSWLGISSGRRTKESRHAEVEPSVAPRC